MSGHSAGMLLATIVLDVLAVAAVVASLRLQLDSWPRLPERVAIHFGLRGRPDSWGPKQILVALPVLAVLFTVGTILAAWLPGPAVLVLLVRLLLVEVVWTLTYAYWKTIQVGLGEAEGVGAAPLVGALVVLLTALAMVLVGVHGRP